MKEEISILIVDDEKSALRYIEFIILSLGYTALTAASRTECLDIVENSKPDIIFLDIMLGDSNGFDVCKEIKADSGNSNPIIVMYSGMDYSSDDRNRGLEAGIDGYLKKSASGEEIKLTMQLYARIRVSEKKLKRSEIDLLGSVEKVQHLNSVLKALRSMNKDLLEETSTHSLLKHACDKLISTHGYHTAWIGLLNNNNEEFEFLVESGLDSAFKSMGNKKHLNEFPSCVQEILSNKDVMIVSERKVECEGCSLHSILEDNGSLFVRISHGSKVFGFLSVSIPLNLLHESEECNILKAVASDIGNALHNIVTSQQVLRLSNIVRTIPLPISFISDDYRYIAANDVYSELFDLPLESIIGGRVEDFFGMDFFNRNMKEKLDICLAGKQVSFEVLVNYKSRGECWMLINYQPFYNSTDDKNYIISNALDITDRKNNEIELSRQMNELEIFNEAAINREFLVNELRAEVNSLLLGSGENAKYRIIE